ncbi:MAG TPA: GH116 family glycosyl hydrolase, partial [Thermomicrobiales bacterium]|nr:GH116 family glycosyl hydrolase [Thermomicrobiales bacterium]
RHFMDGNSWLGAEDLSDPDFQIGAGCLIDQLVGQYFAHVCGLGYLGDPARIRAALVNDHAYNFRQDLHGHFNHLRTFALGDEAAMLMASYPCGRRPKRPFPYFNEVMTGFEYTAASHMLYEGETALGLEVIEAIRARYDGERRSPFNEAECGHHYARAMASWAAFLALTGFHYSGVAGTMAFGDLAPGSTTFWSTGDAWGTVAWDGEEAEIAIRHGVARITSLTIGTSRVPFALAPVVA